jgi:hypothetical protein
MTAEEIRDAVLFVSGTLSTKMGGLSVALTPWGSPHDLPRISRVKNDDFPQPSISGARASRRKRPTCCCSACSSEQDYAAARRTAGAARH